MYIISCLAPASEFAHSKKKRTFGLNQYYTNYTTLDQLSLDSLFRLACASEFAHSKKKRTVGLYKNFIPLYTSLVWYEAVNPVRSNHIKLRVKICVKLSLSSFRIWKFFFSNYAFLQVPKYVFKLDLVKL